ncbi:MAG TPA: tripartite tricarboxylate transporter substrate-binding protein [Xanthobacteraceae bacterium]|jgi:tripartite-type tricarboxylate transporter receptor subunit TctC|nr:tripartite tricarboxylate transporter substrate-binding protein [Xanthobacteraceae bacterium]
MKQRSVIAALIVLLASVVLASEVPTAGPAYAEDFPSRPITMISGFPPGGPTDALARIVADGVGRVLGQSIVVETVSGAAGTIGAGRVVHAEPDGYTIGLGNWSSHVGAPALYKLDYDVLKDLQPISLVATSPLWIVGKETVLPNTATELISWVTSKPQPATFGTVGTGSAAQLCGIYFQQKTHARLDFVPYRGAGPAIQDLVGGQIDLACLEATSTLPYVKAGKMKAFAVLGEERWAMSPDTPTMIESGVSGLTISFWHGLWTTKGTPQPVVARLDKAVQTALADPDVRKRIETLGQVIFPSAEQNPAALAAYNKAEIDKWWPIIKAAEIKTE